MSDFLEGEANKTNRLIESKTELKFIEISATALQELAQKLQVALPERLRAAGGIFFGPVSRLHYANLAADLGLDPEKLTPEQKQAFIDTKFTNAGHLLNVGGKSLITGTSMTLYDSKGVPFASLEGSRQKKNLDIATQKRFNEIYDGTWEFTL